MASLVSVETMPEKASSLEKGKKKKKKKRHEQTLDLVSVETTLEKASSPEKAMKRNYDELKLEFTSNGFNTSK
jgi:hypothetical protein